VGRKKYGKGGGDGEYQPEEGKGTSSLGERPGREDCKKGIPNFTGIVHLGANGVKHGTRKKRSLLTNFKRAVGGWQIG